MTKPISSRARRTYFNNPLVEESLQHLAAAVDHPTSLEFREYLEQHLHHNSQKTRGRFAQYISQRFSHDGVMNSNLARAIVRFGDSRTGREILYFEMLRAAPLLQEIASLWLAELPAHGAPRPALLSFLEPRLGGRSADQVAQAAVAAFRRLGKLTSPKTAVYIPVWADPPIEAFCYVLAILCPEPTMVKVDLFAGQPILRAMLWPQPAIEGLLKQAERLGHISKISQLDQYHQFTLAGTGEDRLRLLLAERSQVVPSSTGTEPPVPAPVQPSEPAKSSQTTRKRRATTSRSAKNTNGRGGGNEDQLLLFK
jgi:hypothetical protein